MINAVLVEATPHRLRYRCTADGDSTDTVDSGLIVNRGNGSAVGHDLREDSYAGSPMRHVADKANVTTPARALELLSGDGLLLPDQITLPRCHMTITPITSGETINWTCTATDGTSAGDALSANHCVVAFTGPPTQDAAAYLDILFAHSIPR